MLCFFFSDQIATDLQPHEVPLIPRGTEQLKAQLKSLTMSSGGLPKLKQTFEGGETNDDF